MLDQRGQFPGTLMRRIGFAVILSASVPLAALAAGVELPPDADMIAHFKAHREEFDQRHVAGIEI